MAVVYDISMSLDGFVTGPNDNSSNGLGDGGEPLHNWVMGGVDGWGDDPPWGMPVFVVTHRTQPTETRGGTRFTFVTDGIESTLHQAADAAGGKNVHLGGGASIGQQFLAANLVDELQLHIAPIVLGAGRKLFEPGFARRFEVLRVQESPFATHIRYRVLGR